MVNKLYVEYGGILDKNMMSYYYYFMMLLIYGKCVYILNKVNILVDATRSS